MNLNSVFATLEQDHTPETLLVLSDFCKEEGHESLGNALVWIQIQDRWPTPLKVEEEDSFEGWDKKWLWSNYDQRSHLYKDQIPNSLYQLLTQGDLYKGWRPSESSPQLGYRYYLDLETALLDLAQALERSSHVSP